MSDIGQYLECKYNGVEIFEISTVVQNLFSNKTKTENQNFLQLVTAS